MNCVIKRLLFFNLSFSKNSFRNNIKSVRRFRFRSGQTFWGGERSGSVLDSRQKGLGFEPHRRQCVVVLEQNTFILA